MAGILPFGAMFIELFFIFTVSFLSELLVLNHNENVEPVPAHIKGPVEQTPYLCVYL